MRTVTSRVRLGSTDNGIDRPMNTDLHSGVEKGPRRIADQVLGTFNIRNKPDKIEEVPEGRAQRRRWRADVSPTCRKQVT